MKALVKTRIYRPARLRLGPIVILGLELIREEWGEARIGRGRHGGIVEGLYSVAASRTRREYRELGGELLVETEVEGPGHTASDGEGRIGEARMLLCPYPSRLHSVAIKYADGSIKRYEAPQDEEFYVYEGLVEAEEPWEYMIIEAENCRRVILDVEASGKGRRG